MFILFKDNNVLCECDYNSHKDLPNMIEFFEIIIYIIYLDIKYYNI